MRQHTLHRWSLGYMLNAALLSLIVTLANVDAFIINTRRYVSLIKSELWQDRM
jgi:hypothetical protein